MKKKQAIVQDTEPKEVDFKPPPWRGVKIEKGIPMPTRHDMSFHNYPWKEMQPGDCFTVSGFTTKTFHDTVDKARRTFKPMKFATRTVMDANNKIAVRVWRVA